MSKINFESLVPESIQSLSPYQPGGFISQDKETEIIKLASNENPLGSSPSVLNFLSKHITSFNRYPDSNGHELKEALSHLYRIEMDEITLGNGSENLVQLLIQTFNQKESEILIPEYSFGAYKINAKALQANVREVPSPKFQIDVDGLIQQCSKKTRLIFIANPNNPTGCYLKEQQLSHLLENIPESTILVCDEAYYEYAKYFDRYPDTLKLQQQHKNLVILRTFSKAYGLASLRIGYSISTTEISELLNRARLPFNTSQISQIAAKKAIIDKNFVQESVMNNQNQLMKFSAFLNKHGIKYLPTATNFLTVFFGKNTNKIYNFLLNKGVMVRPLLPYNMSEFLRISIGNEFEMNYLIECLSLFLGA